MTSPSSIELQSAEQSDEDAFEVSEMHFLSNEDILRLSFRGYKTGKLIGHGSVGQVYRGKCDDMICAVKMVKKHCVNLNELNSMKLLRHPHVVQLIDMYITTDLSLLIFMELLEGGSITDYLYQLALSNVVLSENQTRHYYLQIGDGLRYMHSLGFAHGDLHTGNILLDRSNQLCKISDFGSSSRAYNQANGEMYLLDVRKVDIHDMGTILGELLRGNLSLSMEVQEVIRIHHHVATSINIDTILTTQPWCKMAL